MAIMLYTVAFVLCLPSTVWAQSSLTDIVDVARPAFLSAKLFYAQVADFWTPERLRSAELLNLKLIDSKSGRSFANENAVPTQTLTTVPGSLPPGKGIAAGSALSSDARLFYNTTGRAFWSVGGILRSCAASVVQSNTADLIVTAGQCVHDTKTNSSLINGNWVFVPAYENGSAPFGIWPARRALTLRAWTQAADLNYDVAFVALSILKSRSIRATVGSQGIGFSQPRRALTYSVGYPLNTYGGQYLQLCSGKAQQSEWKQNNFVGQGLSCIMGSGGVGGPWLQSVNDATGRGVLTSLNSFTISDMPNIISGPYFGGQVMIAWSIATNM